MSYMPDVNPLGGKIHCRGNDDCSLCVGCEYHLVKGPIDSSFILTPPGHERKCQIYKLRYDLEHPDSIVFALREREIENMEDDDEIDEYLDAEEDYDNSTGV